MTFQITHETHYAYHQPAAEAYLEVRLTPPERPGQRVLAHEIVVEPATDISGYTDVFGNTAGFFSVPYRHDELRITSHTAIATSLVELPPGADITVQETRQILHSALPEHFAYTQWNNVVTGSREASAWARKIFQPARPVGEAVFDLSHQIYRHFTYRSGATDISTPLATVWRQREGVCQDFAHIALAILRAAGLPARYVCGYIETDPPKDAKRLIGSVATHAWIEVLVPGMQWIAVDPTNDQWIGERHVAVAVGRDFRDAAPVRGTFKGSGHQTMRVSVTMKKKRSVKVSRQFLQGAA